MRRLLVFLPVFLATAPSALGVTDEEIYRDFRFNIINPGARSLALGGAFTSLADDATAAQANPAGLATLRLLEVFAELRTVDNGGETIRERARIPGVAETFVASGSNLADETSPTFFSVVVPVADHWVIAASRQEVLRSEAETLSSFAFTFPGSPGVFLVDGRGAIDIEITQLNVSAGYRVNDLVAVGASLSVAELGVRSTVENFIVDTEANLTSCPVLEPTLAVRTRADDDDRDLTFGVGVLLQPRPAMGFGWVFRRGASLEVRQDLEAGNDPCGPGNLDLFGLRDRVGSSFANRIHLPDTLGFAFHLRPVQTSRRILTVAFGADRIYYSNLMDGYVAGVNVLTGPDARFTIDDGLDLRAGAEYIIFPRPRMPLALRAGVFSESDSSIRALSTGRAAFATPDAFPGRGRETHVTAGLGIALKQQQYKLDLAVDLADSDDEYLISFIYRRSPR